MSERSCNIIARIFGTLLLLTAGAFVAIQIPAVQTRLIRKATSMLEASINGTVQYSDISVSPSGALLIKDLLILDNNPYTADEYDCGWAPRDTFFCAKTISATFSLKGLLKKEGLHMRRVKVEHGAFNLVSEPIYTTYLHAKSNIQRIFNLPEVPEDKIATPGPNIFDIRKFKVTDFRYSMTSFLPRTGKYSGTGIRYDNLDAHASEISGHGMKFTGGKMYATCDHCACTEKSGYEMYHLSGDCEVGLGRTLVRNLHLVDPWSDAHIRSFSMSYRNSRVFKHFLDRVLLEAEFEEGVIGIPTITYFSTALAGNNAIVQTHSGHVKGYVSDFMVDELDFTELSSGISGVLNGGLKGIPHSDRMEVDVTLKGVELTAKQLNNLLKSISGKSVQAVAGLAPGQKFTVNVSAKGPLNNTDASVSIGSGIGEMDVRANIRNLLDKYRNTEIRGNVRTRQFNIGKVLGTTALGPVSMESGLNASLGRKLSAGIDSLSIASIQMLGKEFKGLQASGHYGGDGFDGRISSFDPKLRLRINVKGQGEIADGNADYNVDGQILRADLHALGIDPRDEDAIASMSLGAKLVSNGKGGFDSNAMLKEINIADSKGPHLLPDITARYSSSEGNNSMALDSDMVHGEFTSKGSFQQLVAAVQNASTRRELPALYSTLKKEEDNVEASFVPFSTTLDLYDTRELLAYIMPGLYIADGTSLKMDMTPEGQLSGHITSQRLAIGTNYIKNAGLRLDNHDGKLSGRLKGDEFKFGAFSLAKPTITADADDNDFFVNATFDKEKATNRSGDISISGNFSRDGSDSLMISAHPQASFIRIDEEIWKIGESDILIRGKDIELDNFSISNKDQKILVNGGISGSRADTLNLMISKLGLALIDSFLPQKYDFSGEVNGSAYLISPAPSNRGMMLRMDATDVAIGSTRAGDFTLAGRWDEEENRIKAYLRNEIEDKEAMMAVANFDPERRRVEAELNFDGMNPAIAKPFVSSIFSDFAGSISGRLEARGPVDTISLASKGLKFDQLIIKPVFTGVTYTLDGPVEVNDKAITLQDLNVSDGKTGKGTLKGTLSHDHLKHMNLDASLRFRQLEALDLKEQDKKGFYGNILASGNIVVHGPLNDLRLEAQASTSGDGSIHIPLNSALVGSTSNLLTFKEPEVIVDDPYELMMNSLHQVRKNSGAKFSARARLTATPGVTAFMELDKDSGNVLSVFGSGTVDIVLDPSRDVFGINGDYSISGGKFHVNLANLLDRELTIKSGGSIKFNGAIPDSELDVTTIYNVRTSLGTLVADTKSVSTRRNVEASLRIHDKLNSLRTDFNISIPDLDPTTKAQVESALNSEDKVQKQFVALLMLGSFIPGESFGVFNGNNAIYSNVSSIVVGQLNNIMQKLDIPVGFGFDYQLSNAGQSIFDVAIGTQLFNNRVEVNGSLGNREHSAAGGHTSIVGDFDASLKLDKAGKFRLNAFSHSADEYTSFLDYSQRNGGGLSYQVDFNDVADLIRSMFSRKNTAGTSGTGTAGAGRARGDQSQRRPASSAYRNTVTINIEDDHK